MTVLFDRIFFLRDYLERGKRKNNIRMAKAKKGHICTQTNTLILMTSQSFHLCSNLQT